MRYRNTPIALASPQSTARYSLYTDGASRRDGRGGWGFVLFCDGKEVLYDYGGKRHTTNMEMELLAPIKALQSIRPGAKLTIYSDSKYVVEGITENIDTWLRANWRTGGNKPIKHKELWELLGHLDCDFSIRWQWVKGHSANPGNDRADELATLGVGTVDDGSN